MWPLSDWELFELLTNHKDTNPIFAGVFSHDNLPNTPHCKPTLYIVNTAKESHPTGVHWVAMLVGIPTSEYFDSLGKKPHSDFVRFLGPNYMHSMLQLQNPSMPSCGFYCLYWSVCRAWGIPFDRIVQALNNSNDVTITQAVQLIQPLTRRNCKLCLQYHPVPGIS